MTYVYDPRRGFPRVLPELVYDDAEVARNWLTRVFGFRELLRVVNDDTVQHVDMELDGGIIMLTSAGPDYRNPEWESENSKKIIVFVDDLDEHFARAKREGATILSEPAEMPWGLRQYVATDLAGHSWEFSQHVRDVAPEDWGAVITPEA